MTDPFLRLCAARALVGGLCPEPEEAVELSLSEDGYRILINASFELKDDIKELSDRACDPEAKRWTAPIEIFDEVMAAFPLANASTGLHNEYLILFKNERKIFNEEIYSH